MKRKIIITLLVIICFILQTTVFKAISIASIAPNLLLIITSSFGFMRGKKEGLFVGVLCGLFTDIFFSRLFGVYTLIYMYIGYLNGCFKKIFFPEDIKLPIILIGASDFVYSISVYVFMFLFRGRLSFVYYLLNIILPELVYTVLISIVIFRLLLIIDNRLERSEKRSRRKGAKKVIK